jgi:CDP-6-deoxy-D-xylo-4-hexulose-3-dehydrase
MKKKSLIQKKYKYKLLEDGFSKKDLSIGVKVLLSGQITMASQTRKFEIEFAKKLGVRYALMVNSGSSANLLATYAAGNPLRKKRFKLGDEVLIPVLCWSTSLWPLVQFGLKPVFVDVDVKTLNVNIDDLIAKISNKTKAIMLINIHGNSSDLFKVKKIARKKNIILIEDNCEALGSKLKNKYLGTFGDFSTFSFFYSHQITSGEGGMIVCHNDRDYEILFSLRSHGWLGGTRFYPRNLGIYEKYAKKNPNLDPRYIFVNSGFNVRPTDIQAAIAYNQFKRLNQLVSIRSKNRDMIINNIIKSKKWDNQFTFISSAINNKTSWMGLPILLNEKYLLKKRAFLNYLDKIGIETRPIISGSFLNQPAAKLYKLNPKNLSFKNAQKIQDLGFLIGLPTKKISKKNIELIKNSFFKIDKM